MPFEQFKLDESVNQSRGIFNKYIYETSDDTIAEVLATGYFADARFIDDPGWIGGVMECQCSDGYIITQIEAGGTVTNIGVGSGFVLGPEVNNFSGADRAAAEAARDAYAAANPDWLATYDANPVIGIYLAYADGGENIIQAQVRNDSNWADSLTTIGVQGETGANGVSFAEFESVAARDTSFDTPEGLAQIKTGLPISVNIGNNVVISQVWLGDDTPLAYDNRFWQDAGLATTPGTVRLGNIEISSGGNALLLRNLATGRVYVAQGSEVDLTTGSITQDNVPVLGVEVANDPQPLQDVTILTQTSDFTITATIDQVLTRYSLWFAAPTTNVSIRVYDGTSNTDPILIDVVLDMISGENPITFPSNPRFEPGRQYLTEYSTTSPQLNLLGSNVGPGATFFPRFQSYGLPYSEVTGLTSAALGTAIGQIPQFGDDGSGGNQYPAGNGDLITGISSNHPVTLRRDMPTEADAQAIVESSLNDNSALWVVANTQLVTSNRSDAFMNALQPGLLDADGNEIPTSSVAANTIRLRAASTVRIFAANDYRVVNSPVFESDLANGGISNAVQLNQDDSNQTGLLNGAPNQQVVNDRLDRTGLGAAARTFTGSFFCSYGELGNQDTWYGGRQSVIIEGARGQPNGRYTYEVPDPDELTAMFDDMVARGLPEIYTVTIGYQGGSSTSIVRNALTTRAPSVSIGGFVPTTIAQGTSVTYRIQRIGGTITAWERLGVQQAADPVGTFGEVVLQNLPWNNANNAFLPSGGAVLKGYAFPVIGSDPNDGTLRQGLIDAGVSDREIYDGDYVIWSADAFTAWTNGDDWFVLNRDSLARMSREQSNFLAQTSEIDNRVDVGLVNFLTSDARVWISENPFVRAPFIDPTSDTGAAPDGNPRPGDNYAYIGGTANVDGLGRFQFSQNRFNSYITVGITPNFIAAHPESDIRVRFRDTDGTIIEDFNLATDFTFIDDATFTNGTVRHYQRAVSVNYAFLNTIEIALTAVQRHFRMNPDSVDVTPNVSNLTEPQLAPEVIEKLNRAIPDPGVTYASIEDRLMRYTNITHTSPAGDARFFSDDGTGAYPSDLSQFTQVSEANPRFQATDIVLFVAVPEPGNFVLMNTTLDDVVALDQSEPTVDVVESLSVSGTTYFIYRITGITSGNRFEVSRTTLERVIEERNDIANLEDDVSRIDARLSHAVFDLPAPVVDVLDNEVTVTEESTPTIVATPYNTGLGDTAAQTVFYEPNPVAPSGGLKNSQPINLLTGDQARRKLLYFPAGLTYTNQAYLVAFDGTTGRDLIRYANGVFNARVRVPAIPASTTTNTVYPAPSTRVSGAGIWHSVPALTFVGGVPVPEADELFFTRNIPTSAVTLNVQYRGHANDRIFVTGSTTLAGVGGSSDVSTTVQVSTGAETATIEILWRASSRDIRVSVTERVNAGLPTINDVEVILSFDETRTVPATNASTREVEIERVHDGAQVFAMRPSATGTVILVGDTTEIDTGWDYTVVFGASETGHLTATSEDAVFLNYEDFDPIASTITDLENHASLPQFGLFSTQYTHETIVALATQLTVLDSSGNVRNVGDVLTQLLAFHP